MSTLSSAALSAIAVTFGLAMTAEAQLTVFTDQAAWEAAVVDAGLTPTTEDLEGINLQNLQPSSGRVAINEDFSLEVTGIDSTNNDDAFVDGGLFHGEIFPGSGHASYDHVFGAPVRAFGQNYDGAASGLGIQISTPDGGIDILDFYSGFEDGFLGFVSTNEYDRVRIIGSDGTSTGEIYEALDVSYATAPSVLIGKSLRFQLITNRNGVDVFFSETVDRVVDNQVEFANIAGLQYFQPDGPTSLVAIDASFDVTSDDSIVFDFSDSGSGTFSSNADFNGYVFSDAVDNLPPIIGVTIDPSTTFGLTPELITFTDDEIRIDVAGLSRNPSMTATLNLEFGPEPTIPGDYNDDGTVNLADYTVWRDHLGGPAGTLLNDPNGGAIGAAQYNTWKSNFGSVAATSPIETAAVPEPAAHIILLFTLLVVLCYHRRVAI